MMLSLCCPARSVSTSAKSAVRPAISSHSDLRYILRSSATWSLRLRAVWSFFPVSPIRWVRTCSTNMWMSSQPGSTSSFPDSRSSRIPASPSVRASRSSGVIIPFAESIAAWAMLPVMSWRNIRLSKRMEELKSSATGSVFPAVTPAHIFAMAPYFPSTTACTWMGSP